MTPNGFLPEIFKVYYTSSFFRESQFLNFEILKPVPMAARLWV